MVFQNPDNQMIASIVEDDVAFGPENLGVEREEIKERVEWALSKVLYIENILFIISQFFKYYKHIATDFRASKATFFKSFFYQN